MGKTLIAIIDGVMLFICCAVIGHWFIQYLVKGGYFVLLAGY